MPKKILLIRPPIYEVRPIIQNNLGISEELLKGFYSYASQPNALLRIGSYLKSQGHDVTIIDCAAEIPSSYKNSINNERLVCHRNCGNFKKEKIAFPVFHCGMSYEDFEDELDKYDRIDEIWVSCCMTYHWEPAHRIIEISKNKFPSSFIRFGGIYPTLCPEHAKKSGADQIFVGEFPEANNIPIDLSLLNYKPEYIILKSTRGCPNNCSYCAVHTLEGRKMRFRNPIELFNEVESYYNQGIKRFCFWESNLLINSKNHFEVFLDQIIQKNLKLIIEVPEGLQPSLITPKLAKKMYLAGVIKLNIPLETSNDIMATERLHRVSKYNDFINSIKFLVDAGYKRGDIRIFILAGMPEQSIESIFDSMVKVWELGCSPKIMPFTPIPGTLEYNNYKKLLKGKGLEDLHPFLVPFADENIGVKDLLELCCFNAYFIDYFDLIKRLPKNSKIKKGLSKHIKKSKILWNDYYKNNFGNLAWSNSDLPDSTIINYFCNKQSEKNNKPKVLDIGCGTGKNSLYISKKGFNVHGIDISSFAIDNLLPGLNKEKFVSDDFLEYKKYKSNHFDFVIDIGCFHMIDQEKLADYVKKVSSILKKGGHYILRCFSEHGYNIKRFYQNDTQYDTISPFSNYLKRNEIISLLEPYFKIINSNDIFWSSIKTNKNYELVPGMYEFFLEKR